MTSTSPKLFVLSAPSGTGKTTLANLMLQKCSGLIRSISYTTRKPRIISNEQHGIDYFFISEEEFQTKIKRNEFLEWAKIYDYYYGTSKEYIENNPLNKNILFVIDIQGAFNLKKLNLPNIVFIFVIPPSLEVLKQRLLIRNTETPESLQKRLENAKYEMSFQEQYDYVIINDSLEDTVQKLIQIVDS